MLKRLIKRFLRKPILDKDFTNDLNTFKSLNNQDRFKNDEFGYQPCLNDKTSITYFDAHYIYHPAWASRIIKHINPDKHIDISSTLHFCSVLSTFITTEFYDYRPADLTLDNLTSAHADLTNLHFESDSIFSLSCMHTLEHIGLGRYGDPIEPDGDLKAINELSRVCAVNGNLLLVVPVGRKKIMFNAHRIYNPIEFLSYLPNFELLNFALITDENKYLPNASLDLAAEQVYGCGCYWLKKNS